MKKTLPWVAVTLLAGAAALYFWFIPGPPPATSLMLPPQPEAPCAFGIETHGMDICQEKVQPGQVFASLLEPFGISPSEANTLAKARPDLFDHHKLKSGQSYTVLADQVNGKARFLIYETDPIHYVVFDFAGNGKVYAGERPVSVRQREAGGVINGSLWDAMETAGIDPVTAIPLSEIFAWTIDFYHIQKGDIFKVILEEKWADGHPVGNSSIVAAYFQSAGKDFYAIPYTLNGEKQFFSDKGESLRMAFLKAPLKFFHITSRYNKKRFHPILKRTKAHLGTDYAAPTGTPILAVGAGEVVEAKYTSGNGNYVKIKHNGTYSTQYLHMSKFGPGIRKGVRVAQGQVIGYVGSTGLATGPHVCYRFWVNGVQVDPLKAEMPKAEPIPDSDLEAFREVSRAFVPRLDRISLGGVAASPEGRKD